MNLSNMVKETSGDPDKIIGSSSEMCEQDNDPDVGDHGKLRRRRLKKWYSTAGGRG